jgi:hypothetical protein
MSKDRNNNVTRFHGNAWWPWWGERLEEAILATQREGSRIPGNKATTGLRDAFYWVRPVVMYTQETPNLK